MFILCYATRNCFFVSLFRTVGISCPKVWKKVTTVFMECFFGEKDDKDRFESLLHVSCCFLTRDKKLFMKMNGTVYLGLANFKMVTVAIKMKPFQNLSLFPPFKVVVTSTIQSK